MRVSAALPTGVAALLFDSARALRGLEGRLVGLVEGQGYAEAILPILDYVEPYESLLTPASRAELYRFIDRGGEELALRSDFTPLLARLLAPRLAALPLPLRLFYRGDVVRYGERQALAGGGRRETYQLGAELLGADPAAAEREVLSLFLAALTLCGAGSVNDAGGPVAAAPAAAGADRVQVVLGLAGCLDAVLLAAAGEEPAALAAAVARRDREVVRRAAPVLLPIVQGGLPARGCDLAAPEAERVEHLVALRDELAARFPAIDLVVDLAEFAHYHRHPGLAAAGGGARSYYDGLVFRAFGGGGALPLGGGGRYGSLFRALGATIEAAGFSLSLDAVLAMTGGGLGANAGAGAAAAADPGEDGAAAPGTNEGFNTAGAVGAAR